MILIVPVSGLVPDGMVFCRTNTEQLSVELIDLNQYVLLSLQLVNGIAFMLHHKTHVPLALILRCLNVKPFITQYDAAAPVRAVLFSHDSNVFRAS